MKYIMNRKLEILNYIFKSKDGASWNEVSEMLNDLVELELMDFMKYLSNNDISVFDNFQKAVDQYFINKGEK